MAQISFISHHSQSLKPANSEKVSKSQEEMVAGTILGIDFGQSKVGLAIADEETKIAFAFDTLQNNASLLKELKEIIECEDVKTVVIGMTRHEKDEKSAQEKLRFGKKIEKELGINVEFHEEMFSTKMAHENIKMRGIKNIAKMDDQEAARIILQSWLDASEPSHS